jgi:hypothetical protein
MPSTYRDEIIQDFSGAAELFYLLKHEEHDLHEKIITYFFLAPLRFNFLYAPRSTLHAPRSMLHAPRTTT